MAAPSRRNSGFETTAELGFGARLADDALDLVAGADRHGRLGYNDREAVERGGDLARGGIDVGQVGMAVTAARRRADRDEHRGGLAHRLRQPRGEAQPAGPDVARHQRVEARLEDRHVAAFERRDLVRIAVDADHVMAEIGEAGAGDEADVAGADHRNAHEYRRVDGGDTGAS